MAINLVTFSKIKEELGYSRWNWIPLLHGEVLDNSKSIPYARIPENLLPASQSQTAGETNTCSIIAPWGGFADPFSEFFLGGGTTGTVLGALNGLKIVEESFKQKGNARYGLGQQYLGPELGYCAGTLFKEKMYSIVEARNILNFNPLITSINDPNQFGSSKEQLIWRSRFERFYLNNGKIQSLQIKDKATKTYTISINTKSETTAVGKVDFTSITDRIRLTKKSDGKTSMFDINEVRGVNGGIEIDVKIASSTDIFTSGDYFELSTAWLIQDPYLMDGLMREISENTIPSGTQEFFKTDQNTFFSEGSITGSYIRRKNLAVGDIVEVGGVEAVIKATYETDPADPLAPLPDEDTQRVVKFVDVTYTKSSTTDLGIPTSSVDGGNPISMPTPNSEMTTDFGHYWSFYPISSGTHESEVFTTDERSVIRLLVSDTGETEYKEVSMEKAETADYTSIASDDDISYMRVEISHGGKSTRTNFHDPALVERLYSQGGKLFEILGQDGGNVIDISKTDILQKTDLDPDTTPDYILSQEFGWKSVEWYMTDEGSSSNLRTKIFEGELESIELTTKIIKVKAIGENHATTYGQGYYNLGTREELSFFDRFSKEYIHDTSSNPRKLYTKFKGWYVYDNLGNKYEIKDVKVDPTRVEGEEYELTVELEEEPTDFVRLSKVNIYFDKSPLPRIGTSNGDYFVEVMELSAVGGDSEDLPGTGNTNVRICLDGFWQGPQFDIPIPKETKMNLCGGRYWGLGTRAPDNNNAILFMRTPEASLGLSSMFHTTSNEDFVLYYDYDLKSLSIRRGSVEFKEYPMKYELSIGLPSKTENIAATFSASTTEIKLDSKEERLKSLVINSPIGDEVMLFSIGTENNYYGTIINGVGEMDLIGFDKTSLDQDSSKYQYNEQPVSPIYEYKVGKYSSDESKKVYIGVETSDSPVIISTPKSSVSIATAEAEYIKNNQIIIDTRLFDIYQIDDDELMIFMGRRFNPFTVTNKTTPLTKKSNSTSDKSRWDDSNGIFVIGSKNTGTKWGAPISKFEDEDSQYGVLIMESATYCCSIYNGVSNEIVILFVGEKDSQLYLGAYIVNMDQLAYKTFKCVSDSDDQDFLWRPPALEEDVYEKQVLDNYKYDPAVEKAYDQIFIVASESDTIDPQVKVDNVTDFGIVSTYTTTEGYMMAFYDSLDGIQMIFSKDSGRTWTVSKILLAEFGKSGFYSGGILFFITSDGIISKIMPESLLTSAFDAVEGSSASSIELIQKSFNDQIVTSLKTGYIPTQKLSAHNDKNGIFHVFYYDENGRLSSAQGTGLGWRKTHNF
jgi:hypothetical protein